MAVKDLGWEGFVRESPDIFFGPRRGGTPVPPPPKAVPTQEGACDCFGEAVDRGVVESSTGESAPKINACTCPLIAGGVCIYG